MRNKDTNKGKAQGGKTWGKPVMPHPAPEDSPTVEEVLRLLQNYAEYTDSRGLHDAAYFRKAIELVKQTVVKPELKEARLTAEEVLRVISISGPVEGEFFMEDVREVIGRKLGLTDAALLEAWETIEQDRMKKERDNVLT